MIFSSAFEELNHDNNENQQTEVNNDDVDDTVNVKRPSKASWNFTKLKILLKQCKRLFY